MAEPDSSMKVDADKTVSDRPLTVHLLLFISILSALQATTRLGRTDGPCAATESLMHFYAATVFFLVMSITAYGTNMKVVQYYAASGAPATTIRSFFFGLGVACHIGAITCAAIAWDKIVESGCDELQGASNQAGWVVIVTASLALLIESSDLLNRKWKKFGDDALKCVFLGFLIYVIVVATEGKHFESNYWLLIVLPPLALILFWFWYRNKNDNDNTSSKQSYSSTGPEWHGYTYIIFALILIGAVVCLWASLYYELWLVSSSNDIESHKGCLHANTDYDDVLGLGMTVPGYLIFMIAVLTYTFHAYLRNGFLLWDKQALSGTELVGGIFFRDSLEEFNCPASTLTFLFFATLFGTGLWVEGDGTVLKSTGKDSNQSHNCEQFEHYLKSASWIIVVVFFMAMLQALWHCRYNAEKTTGQQTKVKVGYTVNVNIETGDTERMLRPTTRLTRHNEPQSTSNLSF